VEDLRFWGTKLNLTRTPSHFIIDKHGYIVYKCFGIVNTNDFSRLINNVLIKNKIK